MRLSCFQVSDEAWGCYRLKALNAIKLGGKENAFLKRCLYATMLMLDLIMLSITNDT
jgi:hypothetical protein